MIGIGIPIAHRRTPRMDLTSFSDCLRNVSGLTEFRAAVVEVRPGDNHCRLTLRPSQHLPGPSFFIRLLRRKYAAHGQSLF